MRCHLRLNTRMVKFKLKCQRGASTRTIKISSVSNQDVTEKEFEQWKKLTLRSTALSEEFLLGEMKQKAQDIIQSQKIKFDENTAALVLKQKPTLEFNAQKQSKMQFMVQCSLSQMDISGIRDTEADELESKYQENVKELREADQTCSP
jgi:phosphopantetheinyl transferase (holo-ACP synthase)